MSEPKVYVAGPLGFSEAGRFFLYEKLIPGLESIGYGVLDPWKLTPGEDIQKVIDIPEVAKRAKAWKFLNKLIGKNNRDAIKIADLIVAVLDGTDVDSGTSGEIGYAYGLGKVIEGYRGDFRLASDNDGCVINLQIEFFILDSSGEIVTTLDALIEKLVARRTTFT